MLRMMVLVLCWVCTSNSWARTPIMDHELVAQKRYLAWVSRQPHDSHSEAYRFIADIHRDLAPWVRERPGVVRPFVVGHSVEKRSIWGFRVSRPGTEVHSKILVFAGIHALEWISTETAAVFLDMLIENPPPGVEVVVVPLLNPDGRARVEDDRMAGQIVYRRANARKVDLNRDFSVHRDAVAIWKHLIPGYYSHSPEPLSQPESRALDRLLEERFDFAISLHAFGGFIYTPWAGRWKRPDDWKEIHQWGTVMSQAQGAHAYKVRQLSRWGFFFRAQGAEIDHIYGQYGTLAYLIELTRSGLHPFRPSTWKDYFRWYNPSEPEPHVEKGSHALRALVHTRAWQDRANAAPYTRASMDQ